MLVLSRKQGEKLLIGDDITITVIEIRGDRVCLGFEAPGEVAIHRKEVWQKISQEASNASERACSTPSPIGLRFFRSALMLWWLWVLVPHGARIVYLGTVRASMAVAFKASSAATGGAVPLCGTLGCSFTTKPAFHAIQAGVPTLEFSTICSRDLRNCPMQSLRLGWIGMEAVSQLT